MATKKATTTKPPIPHPNAIENERVEKEHLEKFKERLSIIVLTSTPRGRRAYRRIKAETIECAKAVLPELVARVPVGNAIDAQLVAEAAMALARTMVNAFAVERLI